MAKVISPRGNVNIADKADVICKSMSGLGQGISKGAERVADIILDEQGDAKGQKTKKVTDETLSMFKGVSKQLKSDLKGVKGSDLIGVIAFSAGKTSARVKHGFKALLDK
ncbi:MAG: hypothetical protein HQL17_02960 [Candidatus Omnitrophica bacterium]|nr:hypothetical protein [Candidatus Omnitrophota bacterium]